MSEVTSGNANLSGESGFRFAHANLNKSLSELFKTLLETKHLYQKVTLRFEEIVSEARNRTTPGHRPTFDQMLKKLPQTILMSSGEAYTVGRDAQTYFHLQIIPTNIKLFCEKCSRVEAHKPIWWTELSNDLGKPAYRDSGANLPVNFQMWLIAYHCQSCTGLPQGMLVRRLGWNLHLEGRSPIEFVEIPAFLPKVESHWFRDAVVAENTGKTLAALFYLRTFIEQFARRQTGMDGRFKCTDIMEAYGEILPTEQKNNMPSLKHWYEKLSEALHGASEDRELFANASREIQKHFDIRRVFEIPDVNPEGKKAKAN